MQKYAVNEVTTPYAVKAAGGARSSHAVMALLRCGDGMVRRWESAGPEFGGPKTKTR